MLREIIALARSPSEESRLCAVYRRMPEVGGARILRPDEIVTLVWTLGEVEHTSHPARLPGLRRSVVPISTGRAICSVFPTRVPRRLAAWMRKMDARIRAEASAAGMRPPGEDDCAVRVCARAAHLWVVETLQTDTVAPIVPSYVSHPSLYLLVPGAYAPIGGVLIGGSYTLGSVHLLGVRTGVPESVALDYVRGRLPRTAWEAEVAMAKLGGLP